MDLVDSVPISNINSENVIMEVHGHCNYYDKGIKFNITNVNLTERDNKGNPLITNLARKKRINVTISGYIDEQFKVTKTNLKKCDTDRPQIEKVDIKGENINITFNGIRIIREKTFNDSLQTVINVPRLMIDNTHELYGFLKPIYVNKGEMSPLSEKNIYLSFQELVELLKNSTVNLGVTDKDDDIITNFRWVTEYKKGDSNG